MEERLDFIAELRELVRLVAGREVALQRGDQVAVLLENRLRLGDPLVEVGILDEEERAPDEERMSHAPGLLDWTNAARIGPAAGLGMQTSRSM